MAWQLEYEDFFSSEKIPLKVISNSAHRGFPMHSHDFCEMVIMLDGHGEHLVEKKKYNLSAGDVFILGKGQTHAYGTTSELAMINIIYDDAKLQMPDLDLTSVGGYKKLFPHSNNPKKKNHGYLHLYPEETSHAEKLALVMQRELQNQQPGFLHAAVAGFMGLIVFLSRCYESSKSGGARQALRLEKVIDKIEKEYAEPITVDDLAEKGHMSRSSLHRAFQAAYGMAPIEYLIKVRIARACEFLRYTDMGITDIAGNTGFVDSNYFSRLFRKGTGLSPRGYRKKYCARP